jgi:hypothetical protein
MAIETPCSRPGANADDWFAPVGSTRELNARRLCLDCPLYWACQEYAIDTGIPHGTFGGIDELTRKRIWAQRPGGKPTTFLDDIDAAVGIGGINNGDRRLHDDEPPTDVHADELPGMWEPADFLGGAA